MSIMRVTINGVNHLVDSPDLRSARSWAKQQVRIDISPATATDLSTIDISKGIPELGNVEYLGIQEEALA